VIIAMDKLILEVILLTMLIAIRYCHYWQSSLLFEKSATGNA